MVSAKSTPRRVLIIDDDVAILEVVQIVLQSEGFTTDAISEVGLIHSKLKKFFPDLILLDFWLPGQNGGVLARTLKHNKQTSHIPIIMISANTIEQKKIREIGVDGFLAKPFDITDLISIVNKHLARN